MSEGLPEWGQGVCEDGAAILRDGVPVSISEMLRLLGERDRMERALDRMSANWLANTLHEAVAEARGIAKGREEAADRLVERAKREESRCRYVQSNALLDAAVDVRAMKRNRDD